jgi:hypothetical protein
VIFGEYFKDNLIKNRTFLTRRTPLVIFFSVAFIAMVIKQYSLIFWRNHFFAVTIL